MFTQHQITLQTDLGGIKPFVIQRVLKHAIGMQSGFVGKNPTPNHRFPFRYQALAGVTDQLRKFDQATGIDTRLNPARMFKGHDHFFKSGIAGPFSQTINRGADKLRPGAQTGEGIGRRHAEVIVGMNFQRQINLAAQCGNPFEGGERIEDAEGVTVTETIRAFIFGNLQQFAQKGLIGATGIFTDDRNIKILLFGKTNGDFQLFLDPGALFAQLECNMNIRDRKGNIDSADPSVDRGLNIGDQRPIPGNQPRRQAKINQRPHPLLLVAAHGRDAAFQFGDADFDQQTGDSDFFCAREDNPRRLFAVAQGRVTKNNLMLKALRHLQLPSPSQNPNPKGLWRQCRLSASLPKLNLGSFV